MTKLSKLLENNRQWAEDIRKENQSFFEKLAEGQSPEYLWIGCSDSRVPATQLVDLAPGDLFVHRNIANLIIHSDLSSQAVLQYSVEVLKVKHIIICGHYGCGGVQAAMQNDSLGLIDNWLMHIRDTYQKFEEEIKALANQEEKANRLCECNVEVQVYNVCHNPFVQKAWNSGQELAVHGLIYNLEDGLLKDLDLHISSNEEISSVYSLE